jgi:HAD superfamily hydrolase (TIGR01509 family)
LSRREVAKFLVKRFDLARKSRDRMAEFGVNKPWQAYVQVRLSHYRKMISDPETLRDNQWPHSIQLLRQTDRSRCKLALATMSRCKQAQRVLEVLKLQDTFDFIATRDDVNKGKPDPEIYQLVALELGISPDNCLVIEDSASGVKAALAAGMQVVALATPFTKARLHDLDLLPAACLVDDPVDLAVTVREMMHVENS